MKNILMLLAAAAFSTAAFAQGDKAVVVKNDATGAKTTTTVRDNGTVKTESRTGRTKAGQKVYNTKEDAKVAGQKTGKAVKKGAKAVETKAKDVVD